MLSVGDALRGLGQDTPKIRRLYAQGLIEEGKLSAALDILRALVADTAADPRAAGENAEARGLIGRVHKQRFVARTAAENTGARLALEEAVKSYYGVYTTSPGGHARGLGSTRSRFSPGLRETAGLSPATRTTSRSPATSWPSSKGSVSIERTGWDFGTALEACVASQRLARSGGMGAGIRGPPGHRGLRHREHPPAAPRDLAARPRPAPGGRAAGPAEWRVDRTRRWTSRSGPQVARRRRGGR